MHNTLIIGATSSIAQQVARASAARGERLYLIGRSRDKLAALVAALGPAVVGFRAADLADTSQSAALIESATAALGALDSVLIAHGELGDQLASERDFQQAERAFQVNLLSAVSLLIPVANQLEAQGHGAIVVISSVAGDRGRPRNYTYGAAKGALSIYLQGVRSRLYPRGVRVVTIRLGPVDTPMTIGHTKNALFAPPESVARAILSARDRGPVDVYVPGSGGPSWLPCATCRSAPSRGFVSCPAVEPGPPEGRQTKQGARPDGSRCPKDAPNA